MQETLTPASARKGKRFKVIVCCLLGVCAVVAGVWLYFSWSASAELEDIIAYLDRTDPGWRLEEIEAARKEIPAEENSALQVMLVYKLLGGQNVAGKNYQAFEKMFEKLTPAVQLNSQQAEFLRGRFLVLNEALVEARKLKDMPEGRYPISYAPDWLGTILKCQEAREIYDLLVWDSAIQSQDDHQQGALEAVLALLNASRSVGDEPTLISQLVRYAGIQQTVTSLERALAQGEAEEATVAAVQTAIENEIRENTFWTGLRGERAGMYKAFDDTLFRKEIFGAQQHLPGHVEHQRSEYLRGMTEMLEAKNAPLPDQPKAFSAPLERHHKQGRPKILLLLPGAGPLRACLSAQASMRCAQSALAAERFRIARKSWPASLEDLVAAKLLDAVPDDPFAKGPLKLKALPDGILIYSVGPDGVDNGGIIDREQTDKVGTDIGFQLWNVNARRQPPLPIVKLAPEDLAK